MSNSVRRCFSEKKNGFNIEAKGLLTELREHLGVRGLEDIRIFHRYDAEGLDEALYEAARRSIFSEAVCDNVYDEAMPKTEGWLLAVEALPGQFDQRADSLAQCIQLMAGGERPVTASATVYAIKGELSADERKRVRAHLINPVEAREASLEKPQTLRSSYPAPQEAHVLDGFIALDDGKLRELVDKYGLAMDENDVFFLRDYFRDTEKRNPTITELRVLDTYWSDHCRHTTFQTALACAGIEDESVADAYDVYLAARKEIYAEKAETRPVTLMDMATIAAKVLKKRGLLKNLDESDEINACTVKIKADVDGKDEDWLLLFKNETHNHPTEIEPFGGAATCLGGAIRDPLSGRAYVYQAMRVTGAADPRTPLENTVAGKLSQRRLTTTAAAGYSSYGNQIGLATGLVEEIYHPGYVAKRLEIGAVVGAAPSSHVRREEPIPGDIVILLGGKTGRDGCGGATGSSKSHSEESLATCGAEVQKGNPPEERKLQRLFRDAEATLLIKRCNDFGAGGVSVAVGELADGLRINLDAVPKKYEGLDGTELAISESQERMAVVVAKKDVEKFKAFAEKENIEATVVAVVTAERRLVMEYRGRDIVNVSRDFLDTNGAPRNASFEIPDRDVPNPDYELCCGGPQMWIIKLAGDLAFCSRRGLTERFDGSIGASSVLMPFGGKKQLTPSQVMAAKLPVYGETTTASVMAYGFDPFLSSENPFVGAACAVTDSMAKLVAAGCDPDKAYLTFQEYFERLRESPERWGKPVSSLLGAMKAQLEYGVAAIGGKDSMSGSFGELDVPPTLVSFAIATENTKNILTPELKEAGNNIYMFTAPYEPDGMPSFAAIKEMWQNFRALAVGKNVKSAYAIGRGGVAEALMKMSFGNEVGVRFGKDIDVFNLFYANVGGIVAELSGECDGAVKLGETIAEFKLYWPDGRESDMTEARKVWEDTLEGVFPVKAESGGEAPQLSYTQRNTARPTARVARPKAIIPVFPGTNCEYDTARAVRMAGGDAEILVVRNSGASALAESASALEKAIRGAQMVILPGGFSGGDEPEGSGKFIASFLRNGAITDAVRDLLFNRDGLMLGICNGFQALIKLGLVPFGDIRELDDACPTLTFNNIGRHQSRYVTTRVASVKSPWLAECEPGTLYTVPVSHGEGRFSATKDMLRSLSDNGQIAFQYTDSDGKASGDIRFNPNGSIWAIEGITSPDGRVLGKMAHTERVGVNVAKNIYGEKLQPIFAAGVKYFK